MNRLVFIFVLGLVLVLSFSFFAAPTAQAAGTVTNCTNDTDFSNKLSGGGNVSFNCGTKSITLSSTKTISANTVIDGGNKITLSGGGTQRLFIINSGVVLTLQNIVLTDGYASGDGGAIYNGYGGLALKNATIEYSKTDAGHSGGAIVSYGPVTMTNSSLISNQGGGGGGLYLRFGAGKATINNSVFFNNKAVSSSSAWGGAILLWDGASVNISSTDIYSNSADYGAGIMNDFADSQITLQNSTLRNNVGVGAVRDGAGIYSNGPLSVMNTVVSGNHGQVGAGIYQYSGNATLSNDTFSGNIASDEGGAVHNKGALTATNVTFVNNQPNDTGGAGIANSGTVTMTNSTFSGNSFSGMLNFSHATLTNVTFSGNSETLYNGNYGVLALRNVIIANTTFGGNCNFAVTPSPSVNNLSDDNTCNFGAGRDKVNVMLGALSNTGGATQTFVPKSGSPAINGGTSSGCPSSDQRGVHRPQGGKCDVGSVEVLQSNCTGSPAKPILDAPKNTKKASGPEVALDWQDTHCALRYQVIVKNGSSSGKNAFKQTNLAVSGVTIPGLTKNQTYAWQVSACNSHGCTTSSWWTFKVK